MKSDLESIVKDWISLGKVPEVGWGDIRLLDFQDLLRYRATLNDKVEQSICLTCPEFSEHVCSGCPMILFSTDAQIVQVDSRTEHSPSPH